MAVNAKDLITIADVKTFLSISGSTYDTLLQDLVTQVSYFLESYCDRQLIDLNASITEIMDGGDSTIMLKSYPVKTVVSVSINTGPLDNPNWFALSASYYNYRAENGSLYVICGTPKGRQNLKVVYTAGYKVADSTYPVPFDLQLAARSLVAKFYQKRMAQGVLNENIGGASVNWNEEMDPTIVRMLEPFKRMTL